MIQDPLDQTELSLDPDDWEAMRELAHRMVDGMIDYAMANPERSMWHHAPDRVRQFFTSPLPTEPTPLELVYEEFKQFVLPYPFGNSHPRFWGWVVGCGTISGAFADFLASSMNPCAGVLAYHSANYVELQVLDWIKSMLGFPATASGLLTSGCSASNLIALTVARNAHLGTSARTEGLQGLNHTLVLYASEEAHASIQRAVEILGLGSNALRCVPVTERYQMDLGKLRSRIADDRAAGLSPFCIVGAAGTTNTGAVDDLDALADICQHEGLWFHVDGAFGAWAALVPGVRQLVAGMERAHSLACDLHKWMYLPYDIGCVLVLDEQSHRETFSMAPAYLSHGEGKLGMLGEDVPWLIDYGLQYSRSFRALKAWMALKEHGAHKFAQLIRQNINQAQYLAQAVEASPQLELAAPAILNVVCYRYFKRGVKPATLDAVNRDIVVELQEQGIAVPSMTTLKGKRYIHVAITNHRTRRKDLECLVNESVRLGDQLIQSITPTK